MGGEFLGQIRLGKWGKISSGPTPGDLEVSEVKGCTNILSIELWEHELLRRSWRVRGMQRAHSHCSGNKVITLSSQVHSMKWTQVVSPFSIEMWYRGFVNPFRASNLAWGPFGGCQGTLLPRRCHNQRKIALWMYYTIVCWPQMQKEKVLNPTPGFWPALLGSSQPSLIACLFSDVSSDSPDPLSFGNHPGVLDMLCGCKFPTPEFLTQV
jgi:hypothetical protein